jgi:mannose-6-phosphate isomerase-like protein (cupin superfamily)
MPIIQGPNVTMPTDDFASWGLARFEKGRTNITQLHYHDCDEFVFMNEGRCVMRSEGVIYTLEKGDVLVTRMGDEHELLEILEDTEYFWMETGLRGKKRSGHLYRDTDGAPKRRRKWRCISG